MSTKDLTKKIMASAFAVAGLALIGNDVQAQGIELPELDNDSNNSVLNDSNKKQHKLLPNVKFMTKGKTTGAAAPTPTLDTVKTESEIYLGTSGHGKYTLTNTPTEAANEQSIILWDESTKTNKTYYYTPNETAHGDYSTDDMNRMLVNLVNSGVGAMTDVGNDGNWVLYDGTTYWGYDTNKLPVSTYTGSTYSDFAFKNNPADIATFTSGASDNYDVKVSFDNNPDHTKYYNITIYPSKVSHIGSKVEWTSSSTQPLTPSDWINNIAGSKVTVNPGAGTVTGAIRIKTPHNGTVGAGNTWNKYFTYTYTKPSSDYTITQSRRDNDINSNNVNKKVFAGISDAQNGGAIYNAQNKSSISIISDFIGNRAPSSNSNVYGGALSNYASSGTVSIGGIVGDFVGNSSYYNGTYEGGSINYYSYGGAINNYAYSNTASATIGSVVGDFVGNSSYAAYYASFGGAINNYVYNGMASIGSIVGDFVGNSSSTHSGSFSYGGAINSYA